VPCRKRPEPPISRDAEAGRGIRVLVVDTGLDAAATGLPWMSQVTGDPDPGIVLGNPAGDRTIQRYAGHGTFIAGVIRAMAPAAEVIVRAGIPAPVPGHQHPPGTAWESELAKSLEKYLFLDSPDVINLSAGTYADQAGGPMVLNAFHDEVLRRCKGVVLVAAAGNDGGRRPFWPAAAPWAVGVGALAADHRGRAGFSNFGGWVDVYSPGERLVNAFPAGRYTYDEPPFRGTTEVFRGLARWSGTSFAAPVVAGLIAARMSRTGENGRTAARALLKRARRRALPGVGAILLPPRGRRR
jgi:subtilisin family serine protease